LEKQAEFDANALGLTRRLLDPTPGTQAPLQTDLDEAISSASPSMKAQIFYLANTVRRDNWNKDKQKMELATPIFRALISGDKAQRFHRNYGQLGYALKDQTTPDWSGAEEQLSKAIKIRDDQGEPGWIWYEFNRAVCRIMLDQEFKAGRVSSATDRSRILSDLKAVSKWDWGFALQDTRIARWVGLNSVTDQELK